MTLLRPVRAVTDRLLTPAQEDYAMHLRSRAWSLRRIADELRAITGTTVSASTVCRAMQRRAVIAPRQRKIRRATRAAL